MVCLRTPNRAVIVGCGGGRIFENDNINAKITSARVEALGLLAGMHFLLKIGKEESNGKSITHRSSPRKLSNP
jgi:hypothetical protein